MAQAITSRAVGASDNLMSWLRGNLLFSTDLWDSTNEVDSLRPESLDWSLTHVLRYGDTDIVPVPFEYAAIPKPLRVSSLWQIRSRDDLTMKSYIDQFSVGGNT
ncbi:MAG: hypothetical protein DMF73_04975 [Acidobacteria bacterium]|nr:MAG: hypothetical protein DMF73_04975 [Acidobacteriota bacterium]